MERVHWFNTFVLKRLRERFYLWRHFKALSAKGQDCQHFTPMRPVWNARDFILKRFRSQQR